MNDRLIVTASPHIRDHASTRSIMLNVLISMLPCVVASVLVFGPRALLLTAVTTAACVVFEWAYCKMLHKPNPIGDLSACVTGVILALNMPVSMPFWIAIVGAFVAIVITKQLFGGLGFNLANPALVGRIVLFIGFASRMTAYIPATNKFADVISSATPLAPGVDKSAVSLMDVFLGIQGGVIGETCALACILGFIYLVVTETIEATIPVSIIASCFIFTMIGTGFDLHASLVMILSGGLFFGAVFMATDYVTSPFTTKGKLYYGIFVGLLVFLIRQYGSMNEGMSFAILLGNLMTPWFNEWGHQSPLGYVKPAKAKKEEGGAK